MLFLCLIPIESAREAGRRVQCRGYLAQIGNALHNYHDANGSFPPAYIPDESGAPMHSWRVLILPHIGRQSLYENYQFDEPWNGPNNRTLLSNVPLIYQCPSHGQKVDGEFVTNYVVVTGQDTVFRDSTSSQIANITDGSSITIMVVELNDDSPRWMEPKDMPASEFLALFNADAEFNHKTGVMVLLADGLRPRPPQRHPTPNNQSPADQPGRRRLRRVVAR